MDATEPPSPAIPPGAPRAELAIGAEGVERDEPELDPDDELGTVKPAIGERPKVERRHRVKPAREIARRHWPLAVVLALFAASAFVVPTLAPIATTDDWGYSRSVEILYHEGRLTVFPVVAATAVFQIGWGALFALIFGMTLGVMRVATLSIAALGAIALYALLRELGVSRSRSTLGTAAYLFNPLGFMMSYTFMTDSYLTSLMIGSTYFYVRGLRSEHRHTSSILFGSLLAGCAFLTRQQGALIPLAVVMQLLLARRLRVNWASARLIVQITAIPAAATVGYYLWLKYVNNVPAVQQGFFNEAKHAGIDGSWLLTRHLTFIEMMYLGFFALPLAVALIPGLWAAVRISSPRGWIAFCLTEAALAIGLTSYAITGGRWPYIPQFMGAGGLGPPDVLGSRPRIFQASFFFWATVVVAAAAVLLAFLLSRGIALERSPERAGAAIVAAIGFWQVVGILPPSFHYLRRGYSLDRYLLPLLPIGIILLLWATRDLRMFQPLGWAVVAIFLTFSTAAARDYFVYLGSVWSIAAEANRAGVDNTHLDAGAAWDGYHLYTYALDHNIRRAGTPKGPWWMTFYGLASDSTYVVSSRPQPGYVRVWTRDYSSWLSRDTHHIYLLRKSSSTGPP